MSLPEKCCAEEHLHPDHSKQLHRVNRALGQLEGVKRMIEDGRYCPDILTQTRAVISAVSAFEAEVLRTHLEHCVRDALRSGNAKDSDEKINELVDICKRYKRA